MNLKMLIKKALCGRRDHNGKQKRKQLMRKETKERKALQKAIAREERKRNMFR